ncbi:MULTISPECIES: urea amidohydrolase [Pseudoalteromonas]|jgi:hypothetical protein|uniref:Uncharacterized protein n=1 Tax=Pseudoalteromonas aliena SW19 TaxID=1314866 RepID=A0ABR9E4F3_9GAMM|nr:MULTISPECIES: urea amidohydrolase [Pseudoalteromonas]MBE0361422.1 hypothetical protein [Pseudoalteromonas aliena SW19]
MNLTPEGARAAQLGGPEKLQLAGRLVRGEEDINRYVRGVCYDAAAFVKFLLGNKLLHGGAGISIAQLLTTSGQGWISNLNSDVRWNYRAHIPAGSVITFRRLIDNQVFHAAIAVGMTSIRAVNGLKLGAGWSVPANLSTVLRLSPNHSARDENVFLYDNTDIVVQIQRNLASIR